MLKVLNNFSSNKHTHTGLHCRQGKVRPIHSPFGRPLCCQAFPQSPVPHCGAPHQLVDDEGSQQRQEADGRSHRQACFWDHLPVDRHKPPAGVYLNVFSSNLYSKRDFSFLDSGYRHPELGTPWRFHPYRTCWYRPSSGRRCITSASCQSGWWNTHYNSLYFVYVLLKLM